MADMSNLERVQENVRRLQAQGVDNASLAEYLKTEGYTPTRYEEASRKMKDLGGPAVNAGFGRSLLQGLTFNTADEIEAAAKAMMSSGMSAFDAQQTPGVKPRSAYEQELARVRAGIKSYEEQYPGRAFTGELVGGLLPTVAAIAAAPFTGGATAPVAASNVARTVAAIPGLSRQIVTGAKVGAGTGALSGAGASEGGLQNRLTGAVVGGTVGTVLGAGSPVVSKAVVGGGRAGLEAAGLITPQTATQRAQELLAKKLAQEGVSPSDLAQRQAQIVKTYGQRDETLADYGGESIRRLARGAMAIPNASQTDVRQMLTERAVAAGPRITKDITDLTAIGARDIFEVAEEIKQRRSMLASPLYKEAYAAGEINSFAIDNLLKKSKDIQYAISEARRLPDYADLPDNSMLMLDKAYKYIGGLANNAKISGKTSQANDLDNLRISLRDAITEKVPVYGKALSTFSDESLLNDALEIGSKNFLKKSPSEINRELKKFSGEAEQQMYRLGAVQSLRDEIYGMRETGNIADKFLNSREMRDRMRTIFNSTGEYETFIKNLERERQMGVTRARIEGGSPTAPIQQDIAELQGPSATEIIASGAQMARGDLLGGGMSMARQLAPRLQGINENVAQELSDILLNPSFNVQQQALLNVAPIMDELRRRALQQQVRQAGGSATAGQLVPGLLGD